MNNAELDKSNGGSEEYVPPAAERVEEASSVASHVRATHQNSRK